jgi:uncharacterized protein (TIGR02678 family)
MAEYTAAADIAPSDLESYQHAVRLVVTNDVITATRPTAGALRSVLYWADTLAKDFHELFGYHLEATAHQVRLVRRIDTLDSSQQALFSARNGRAFDRRRLAYLCLLLASFQRSRIEIDLVDLVKHLSQSANSIAGLGFDPTVTEHKRAVVDAVDWLVAHGALNLSEGDAESWARDPEAGDALYDIDHDICSTLFRPGRPIQFLTSARGLLETDQLGTGRREQTLRREAAARRARRLLLEHPAVYYGQWDEETATALRSEALGANMERFTGLHAERRAEGIALVDPSGRFTDRRFPGRGGAVNRAAGLLLAKLADLLEDPDEVVDRVRVPFASEQLDELIARIDQGKPGGAETEPAHDAPRPAPGEGASLQAPFVEDTVLDGMMAELFDEFGPESFTDQWKHDPPGLLAQALVLLDELRLTRRTPGGVLVLPAAARYRNIKAAVPSRGRREGQLALDIAGLLGEDGS